MLRCCYRIATSIFFGVAIAPQVRTFKHVACAAVRHVHGLVFAGRGDLALLVRLWIAPFGFERRDVKK